MGKRTKEGSPYRSGGMRKVFGWVLFAVGIGLIQGFISSIGVASSMPGETNYAIVAIWIILILAPFYGWYRLALRKR